MKWGIIISIAIVVIFGVVLAFSLIGVADRPTNRTSPSKLKLVSLPGDLPVLYEPKNPDASANEIYAKLFKFFDANQSTIAVAEEDGKPDEADVKKVADMLIEAMNAGKVSKPFLDDHTPMKITEQGGHLEALDWMGPVGLYAATMYVKKGNKERALQVAKATFALGHRAFTECVLLENRYFGLAVMQKGINAFWELDKDGKGGLQDQFNPWINPLTDVEAKWQEKLEVIRATKPHIGDLLNVAKNDKDITFRIEAIRWLGAAKFRALSRGNKRALNSAIASFKASDEKWIKKAGETADAFKREDVRRIK